MNRVRKIFHDLLNSTDPQRQTPKLINVGMLLLIFINVIAVILETEEEFYFRYKGVFDYLEIISVIIFTVEYVLRLWTCIEDAKYKSPLLGRIRYALLPSMLIDLLSILPFYIPLGRLDLRFIRAVRLFRIFRLLKMGRYSQSLTKLTNVVKSKKEELFITLFSGTILLVLVSSVMYFVEHEAQPETFGSILDSMWWGAVTLTTVGYGDIYPKTALGRILGVFIAVLGIGLFALPAGIIASGFAAELQKSAPTSIICPHCGREIKPSENK